MRQQTVEIRLELLKHIGMGFTQAETVKHLVEKFGVTESGAYYHFRTKQRWIKDYTDFNSVGDLQDQIFQRFNHVYREASFQYQHCQDHNARIGYLRTMVETCKCMQSFLPSNVESTTDDIKHVLENYSWDLSKMKYLQKEFEEELRKPFDKKHA